jgi:hypothetical protein
MRRLAQCLKRYAALMGDPMNVGRWHGTIVEDAAQDHFGACGAFQPAGGGNASNIIHISH